MDRGSVLVAGVFESAMRLRQSRQSVVNAGESFDLCVGNSDGLPADCLRLSETEGGQWLAPEVPDAGERRDRRVLPWHCVFSSTPNGHSYTLISDSRELSYSLGRFIIVCMRFGSFATI